MVRIPSDQGVQDLPYISQPWLSTALLAHCDTRRACQLVWASQLLRVVGVTRSIRPLRGGWAGPNERKEKTIASMIMLSNAVVVLDSPFLTLPPHHHRVWLSLPRDAPADHADMDVWPVMLLDGCVE
jgi:hypothetical protein